MKLFMMPHTVPNRPTNGAVEPMVASTPVPRVDVASGGELDAVEARRDALLDGVLVGDVPGGAGLGDGGARCMAGTAPRLVSMRLAASAIELAAASLRSAERTRRLAAHSSMLLANHTVQVTTEAKARPIITDFTTMSASMNIFHGDRSRGRLWARDHGRG